VSFPPTTRDSFCHRSSYFSFQSPPPPPPSFPFVLSHRAFTLNTQTNLTGTSFWFSFNPETLYPLYPRLTCCRVYKLNTPQQCHFVSRPWTSCPCETVRPSNMKPLVGWPLTPHHTALWGNAFVDQDDKPVPSPVSPPHTSIVSFSDSVVNLLGVNAFDAEHLSC